MASKVKLIELSPGLRLEGRDGRALIISDRYKQRDALGRCQFTLEWIPDFHLYCPSCGGGNVDDNVCRKCSIDLRDQPPRKRGQVYFAVPDEYLSWLGQP